MNQTPNRIFDHSKAGTIINIPKKSHFADQCIKKTESLYLQLKQAYPFFETVNFDVILHNDTAVVNYLRYTQKTVLAFGSAPNLNTNISLKIKGETLSRTVGFVFDVKNSTHPLIQKVIKTAGSEKWKNKLSGWGYRPVSP